MRIRFKVKARQKGRKTGPARRRRLESVTGKDRQGGNGKGGGKTAHETIPVAERGGPCGPPPGVRPYPNMSDVIASYHARLSR